MPGVSRAVCRCVAALAVWVGVALTSGCAGPVERASPVGRAGWVVRHQLAAEGGAEEVCREASRAQLDTLLLQVRGRGDAYYRSELVVPAAGLAGERDPLAEAVAACSGVRLLAWLNVYLVWEGDELPPSPEHIRRARPEWLLRDADGRSVADYGPLERSLGWIEGAYVDPASSDYRDRFVRLVSEVVARYPVQGVHLDFVRYPGPYYGHSGQLGRRYRDAWGLDPRWIPQEFLVPDLNRWLGGENALADRVLTTAGLLWADLRSSEVTALVRAVRVQLERQAPGMELSAAVFPDAGAAYLGKGQDWRTWAAAGLVDALYPMAYFGGPERVTQQLQRVAAGTRPAAPGVALWAGLGAYIKQPGQLREEAAAARAAGYDGISLFDVGSLLASDAGLGVYTRAVAGPRLATETAAGEPVVPQPSTRGGRYLAAILERASGGQPLPPAGAGERLDRRWAEFEQALSGPLPAALAQLQGRDHRLPPWVELRGVFRFVHAEDGAERRAEQLRRAETARARLQAGEDPAVVAAELSQGGSRRLGGVLPRRYLWPSDPFRAQLAALAPGEVSPVLEASNGYWVYRVERREPAQVASLQQAPWPVRRQLLRTALAEQLARAASSALDLRAHSRQDRSAPPPGWLREVGAATVNADAGPCG